MKLSSKECDAIVISKENKGILDKFLLHLSASAGDAKVLQNKRFILKFLDTINKDIPKITKEDLSAYFGLLNRSGYLWNTQVMHKKIIKRFIKWNFGVIKSLELLDGLSAGEFKPADRTKRDDLTEQDLSKILASTPSLRDKALFALLYESACRPEELLKLKWQDLNFKTKIVFIYSSKTKKRRELPLNVSLEQLNRWKEEYQYPDRTEEDLIFPSRDRKDIMTTAGLNRIINKAIKITNISKPHKITAYTFRRTRLTDIYKNGVQGFEHNDFAGHKHGSKQQATYVKTDEEEMQKAIKEKVFKIKEITPEESNDFKRMEEKFIAMEKELSRLKLFIPIGKKDNPEWEAEEDRLNQLQD